MKRFYIFCLSLISMTFVSCSMLDDVLSDLTVTQEEIAGTWSWLDFTTNSIYGFGEITIDKYGNFSIKYDLGEDYEPEFRTGTIKIAQSQATVKYSDGTIVTSGKIKQSLKAKNRWLINTWEGKTSWADVVIGAGLTAQDRFSGGGGY